MKKYLKLKVTRLDGSTFINPLTMSEVRLIRLIVKENKSIVVTLIECSKEQYKQLFG